MQVRDDFLRRQWDELSQVRHAHVLPATDTQCRTLNIHKNALLSLQGHYMHIHHASCSPSSHATLSSSHATQHAPHVSQEEKDKYGFEYDTMKILEDLVGQIDKRKRAPSPPTRPPTHASFRLISILHDECM